MKIMSLKCTRGEGHKNEKKAETFLHVRIDLAQQKNDELFL